MNGLKKISKFIPLRLRIFFGPYFALVEYIWNVHIRKRRTIKVMTLSETLDNIVSKNKSVIRFGDGEMSLISGENLAFQKYEKGLAENLKNILKSNEEEMLICVPGIFDKLDNFSKRSYWFTLHHLFKYRHVWENTLDHNKVYGDSFITRPYLNYSNHSFSKVFFEKIKKIWTDKDIIIIEGEGTRIGIGNDLLSNSQSVKRIVCPSENAYSFLDEIIQEAKNIEKNKLILLSLGPTAKVIGYELFKLGFRVIDIGHIDMEYEMFLRESSQIVKIPYKYFSEINERNPEECKDPEYLSQIIATIK